MMIVIIVEVVVIINERSMGKPRSICIRHRRGNEPLRLVHILTQDVVLRRVTELRKVVNTKTRAQCSATRRDTLVCMNSNNFYSYRAAFLASDQSDLIK